MARIAAIGECMVELSPDMQAGAKNCTLSFGGDTLNTAVYLARLGQSVSYVTALGDDPFSDTMIDAWQREGIDTTMTARLPGRLPGLYAITTDATGERSFHYWRDKAPARELLLEGRDQLIAEFLDTRDAIYLSGITLSIISETQRQRLLEILMTARSKGAKVAFDPNYRKAGWPDRESARTWFDSLYAISDFAFPTLDDEQAVSPELDARLLRARLTSLGAGEVVVKMGARGCLLNDEQIVPAQKITPTDTTAAGDSFNAAYLSARLNGASLGDSAVAAHVLAGSVIQHPGAIIPKNFMPES